MTDKKRAQIKRLINKIPSLTEGQIYWLDRITHVFDCHHEFKILNSDLFDNEILNNFGDALRIHHCFSAEPFSKDKFEYVFEKVLNMSGHTACLAPKGHRGHDITIDGCPVSLKTQADKNIREEKIWISKFMEMGKGKWGKDPTELKELRRMFLDHLKNYKRIFVLRSLKRSPECHYELVEIPKQLMEKADKGTLEMKTESKQFPKPGYCHVRNAQGEQIYQLYFDAGSERKLQVKNLLKSHCRIHADWKFLIPPE